MNDEFTPEARAARERAASLELDALVASSDEPSAFTKQAHEILSEQNLFDVSALGASLAVMELSRVSASLGAVLSSAWNFGAQLVRGRGVTDDLARRALDGSMLGCVAVQEATETDVRTGPHIEGEGALASVFGAVPRVACAGAARYVLVFAEGATRSDARLLSLDLRTAKEVQRGEPEPAAGLELAAPASLRFTGLLVTGAVVLSAGEAAWAARRDALDAESLLGGAIAAGVARGALERALREVRGLGKHSSQSTDFSLSDMATLVDASELAVLQAARLVDANSPATAECSGAKLVAARTATKVVHDALALCPSADVADLRRAYLDAHFLESHFGSHAAQVDRIAGELLKE